MEGVVLVMLHRATSRDVVDQSQGSITVDQSQASKSARTADSRQQTDRVGNIMKAFCTSYSGFKNMLGSVEMNLKPKTLVVHTTKFKVN